MNIKKLSYKRVFALTVIISFILWLIGIIYDPDSIQRDLFAFRMDDFWADATNTTGYAHNANPYLDDSVGLQHVQYPPLAYVMFYFLARAADSVPDIYLTYYYNPLWTFLLVITLILLLLSIYTLVIKKFGGTMTVDNVLVGIAICVSYPMLYTIERANNVIFAALGVMVFIFYYNSESKVKKEIALLSLAFAAGLKITPALFGVILIYNKDWKAAIRTIIYGILAFVLPFFFFDGEIEVIKGFIHNFGLNVYGGLSAYSFGLTSIFKFYYGIFTRAVTGVYNSSNPPLENCVTILKFLLSAIIIVSGFFTKKDWKWVLNVTIVFFILPKVSGRYCLLYLIPFIIVYLKEAETIKKSFLDRLTLLSFILVSFDYMFVTTIYINRPSLAILILLFVATYYSVYSTISFIKRKKL